ncbi:LuxR C-terminal-related transcriptional regulator [Edwardsiella tarda]|uniref:LuxR C-terminal-related transcriptional regulator n=2 Tax=Edwardsiella tarda TaxID=636 RepID=A0AC61TG20_EDWTA|nr:LuxR C-terminal-related transcriptional regulator [Edwardsiella tarda]ATI63452.1 transcriptional regulator [Edwardsiella tarda]UAL57512.1 LuxR C-terminal-related transcriptional regulator [Edwardsiella tarda]UCP99427.1 LuxR C-terminal-related transcriptional regulator [Edwardsiella tarda ATCC 15947 = NBRC 105688]UCQ10651.1 LuxR C-terminal-related transcriptional regulator [Edwardsiella tarda]UCQ26947.1 LuxR C-terminal-related transcriptional regulator [Edwardsiella tarda]
MLDFIGIPKFYAVSLRRLIEDLSHECQRSFNITFIDKDFAYTRCLCMLSDESTMLYIGKKYQHDESSKYIYYNDPLDDVKGKIIAQYSITQNTSICKYCIMMESLSSIEKRLLCYIKSDYSIHAIAKQFSLNRKTIYSMKSNIFQKLKFKNKIAYYNWINQVKLAPKKIVIPTLASRAQTSRRGG